MRRIDLEGLKAILANDSTTIAVAKIMKVEVLADFSTARALVSVFPEEFEAVVTVSFPHANAGGGWFTLPQANDLVVVGFANKDEGFILGYLASKEDLIPSQVKDGHTWIGSRPGKNLEFATDTKGLIGNGDAQTPPDEPLVLGLVLKNMLTSYLAKHTTHLEKLEAILDMLITGDVFVTTSPGFPTGPNGALTATLTALKTDLGTLQTDLADIQEEFLDTDSTSILSQLWFTEKGGE